ncbi:MAG: polymer-forming cytoskeletal protein [Emcibacteraceae bacterium]|nr:polymer-forming cytoskeletal protein [Emcibacteraceae bacterium]
MFKRSNNKNSTVDTKSTLTPKDNKAMKAPANSVPSIISSDVVIKGNVSTSGEIQLDGTVEGDIKSNSLTIGEHGTVKGKVNADDVIVKGTVKGSITGRNIRVEKSAKITGDLCHQTLSIEAGAFIEGNLSHQSNGTNSATSNNNTTKVVSANQDAKDSDQKKTIVDLL